MLAKPRFSVAGATNSFPQNQKFGFWGGGRRYFTCGVSITTDGDTAAVFSAQRHIFDIFARGSGLHLCFAARRLLNRNTGGVGRFAVGQIVLKLPELIAAIAKAAQTTAR
jgi:hypothetical protein